MENPQKLNIRLEVKDKSLRKKIIRQAGSYISENEEQARIVFTDREETALRFCRSGFLVVGFREGESFFEGADIVFPSPDDFDPEEVRRAYLRIAGLPAPILKTRRLLVRESSPEDYDIFKDMAEGEKNGAAAGVAEQSLDQYLAYIKTAYEFFGFGLWSVALSESGEVIGRCGLQPATDGYSPQGRIELGYLISPDQRRNGYAYEACRGILEFAADSLGCGSVYARIDTRNAASINLAVKLGFEKLSGTESSERISLWKVEL